MILVLLLPQEAVLAQSTPPRLPTPTGLRLEGNTLRWQAVEGVSGYRVRHRLPGRPTTGVNAWVADPEDPRPTLSLHRDAPRAIREIVLTFDSDSDHAMETTLMGHPENVVPFMVTHWRILDGEGQCVAECEDNRQTINRVRLDEPLVTDRLHIKLLATEGDVPATLFGVRCYE